jgi:hypothetical protein
VQLLQRANAAREPQYDTEEILIDTEKKAKLFEKYLQATPTVVSPADLISDQSTDVQTKEVAQETQFVAQETIFEESQKDFNVEESASPIPDRSYRKQYSTGRRRHQNNDATNIKELLKQSGTLSLSEILQQKNLSLSDLLQGKKLALSVLREKQSNENKHQVITERSDYSDPPAQQTQPTHNEVTEKMYTTSTTTKKTPILFNTNQRSSYLSNKRTSPAPQVFRTETRRWPTNTEPEYENNKGDSREDILDLLQPGSPVSLAQLLSSRNMTLAELMEHRERGSRQQGLVDLFSNLLQNTTQPNASIKTAVLVDYEPSLIKNSQQVVSSPASPTRPRGSRDPRLLDLIRRPVVSTTEMDQEDEVEERGMSAQEPDHYEYTEEEGDEAVKSLPVGVQSAILASGGLLGLALVLFAAIFLCCKMQQRRHRGARLPFLRNAKLSKSERNVVIKPAQNKQISHVNRMDDF